MNPPGACLPDLPASPHAAADLAPDVVARLARLTRDYATLSQGQAGWSGLLGGGFLLLAAGVELGGHGWRFSWLGAWSPMPLGAGLAVASLPLLWLGARRWLHVWATERFGRVEMEPQAPERRQAVGRYLLPGLMLLGLVPILARPMPAWFLRAPALVALLLGLHLAWPRMKGRMERLVAILLFVAPCFLLAGIQMAAGDTLLAYPVVGLVAIARGLRDHAAYRKVKRELETLQGLA